MQKKQGESIENWTQNAWESADGWCEPVGVCVTSIIGCVWNSTYLFCILCSWCTSIQSSSPINSALRCCWAILEILPFLEHLVQFALWHIPQPLLLSGWAILQLESLSILPVLLWITLGSQYRVVKRLGEYGKPLPSRMKYWLWGLLLGHFWVAMDYTRLLRWAFINRWSVCSIMSHS